MQFVFRSMVFIAAVGWMLGATPPALAGFGGPDVALYEIGPTPPVTVGQTVTFHYQVKNLGTTVVTKVEVHTHLPGGVSFTGTSFPFGPWGCGGSPYSSLTCGYYGQPVPPGGTFPAFEITAVVASPGSFHICSNVVLVPAVPFDVNRANDQSCVDGTLLPKPNVDLSVLKTGPGRVIAGLAANFAIAVHNGGPSAVNAQSGITVTDALAGTGLTGPVIAGGAGWGCGFAGNTVTCTYAGPAVPAGANLPPITLRARAGATGPHFNCAIASLSGGTDTQTGNNKGCVDFEVRLAQTGPSPM